MHGITLVWLALSVLFSHLEAHKTVENVCVQRKCVFNFSVQDFFGTYFSTINIW
jgi:hypothetical protein